MILLHSISCPMAWLQAILFGLLCALLGYLLRKFMCNNDDEINALKAEIARLKAALSDCESSKSTMAAAAPIVDTSGEDALRAEIASLKADLESARSGSGSGAGDFGLTPLGATPIKVDDLKKIEGIGPKIAELCNGIGIHSFEQLAHAPVATLQKMLDDAGPAYKVHVPNTWPAQANLAAQGLWKQLEAWQDILDGGKI